MAGPGEFMNNFRVQMNGLHGKSFSVGVSGGISRPEWIIKYNLIIFVCVFGMAERRKRMWRSKRVYGSFN